MADQAKTNADEPAKVVVTDIKIPLDSMVTLLVKLVIAVIPAAIILAVIAFVAAFVLGGIFHIQNPISH